MVVWLSQTQLLEEIFFFNTVNIWLPKWACDGLLWQRKSFSAILFLQRATVCVYNKYFSLCSYFKILRFIHSNFPRFPCKASKRCLKQDMQSKIKHASYWLCLQLLRGQLPATLVWRNPCYEKRNWKKAEIKASSFVWASHGNIWFLGFFKL